MRRSWVARLAWAGCVAAALGLPVSFAEPALAQETPEEVQAREAYDRGAAAYKTSNYGVAAHEFARADQLRPNPVALESALKASVLADDAELGMALVERADAALRRAASESLSAASSRAREKFARRVGRLSIDCAASAGTGAGPPCSARVDGKAVALAERRWVTAGERAVEIDGAGRTDRYVVRVDPGATVDWRPPAAESPRASVVLPPPPSAPPTATPPPSDTHKRKPLSPVVFWVGAGATAVLGGVLVWSGVDTLDKYDAFNDGDDSAEAPGRDAQLRTNILIGATAGVGLATAVIGLALVDWSPDDAGKTSLGVGPSGARFTAKF